MHTTRLKTIFVTLVGLCGTACVVDATGDDTTGDSSSGDATTGSMTTATPATSEGSSEGSDTAGPADEGSSTDAGETGTTGGTTASGETTAGDSTSTGAEAGCGFPETVSMTGFPTDGWAYLCFDPDTGACGLVQGQAEEVDPCGDVSGTPALQFFRAIGLSELSMIVESDSINPWELLSSTGGTFSATVVRGLAFDTEYTVTMQPVGSADVYELVVTFGFEGTAMAHVESFGVLR